MRGMRRRSYAKAELLGRACGGRGPAADGLACSRIEPRAPCDHKAPEAPVQCAAGSRHASVLCGRSDLQASACSSAARGRPTASVALTIGSAGSSSVVLANKGTQARPAWIELLSVLQILTSVHG